ncbi:MAG: ATP-binding protein, partial [Gammaproteobacteria bacterium]
MTTKDNNNLHFDVSTGLKRVLGRELITDDEVAIFELVKNSFDAGADSVQLYFGDEAIVVADNGSGMSYEDLRDKVSVRCSPHGQLQFDAFELAISQIDIEELRIKRTAAPLEH